MIDQSSKINVLFVCTGNIFRSMSAEYCLKDFLNKKEDHFFNVSSAGIGVTNLGPLPQTLNFLSSKGIDASMHKKTHVSEDLLKNQDLIICMAKDHQDFISENFNLKTYLFNELCLNERTSVEDVFYVYEDDADINTVLNTVDYIYNNTPKLYCAIEKMRLKNGL